MAWNRGEYYLMACEPDGLFQWRTISEDQENRFSAFRERKSQIEKDVGRTDRNHPFFAGDNNDNVKLLEEVSLIESHLAKGHELKGSL